MGEPMLAGAPVPPATKRPLRLSYFQRVRNVGDAIAPFLIESITGRPTTLVRSTDQPYLLSIGSLLQTSTRQSYVWGTGLIHPSAGIGNPDPAHVLAVRGKLTYAELVRRGVHLKDVPLGDPGIIIGRQMPPGVSAAPRYSLGLVPYVFDRDHPFFRTAAADPNVKILDVCNSVESFLTEIATCGAVASSSLHGLVFAESLGIPSLWLEVSDNVAGGRFKFDDWFSLARNPQREPLRIETFVSSAALVERCESRQIESDVPALIAAITPEVIEQCSLTDDPPRHLVPVAVCRRRPVLVFVVLDHPELHELAASLRPLQGAVEIVLYDDTIDAAGRRCPLEDCVPRGTVIYRRTSQCSEDRIERINGVITSFFRDWAEPSRFAVAFSLADLRSVTPERIRSYDEFLDRIRRADRIGPVADRVANDATAPRGAEDESRLVAERLDSGLALYRAGATLATAMWTMRIADPRSREIERLGESPTAVGERTLPHAQHH